MFSNDQNIETIAQLVEVIKHYVGLQSEYVKLDVVDKVVRLLTVATMTFVFGLLLVLALIYASFATVYTIAPIVGIAMAFGIVATVYIVLLILVCLFRHRWIERPLVHFLATLLLGK